MERGAWRLALTSVLTLALAVVFTLGLAGNVPGAVSVASAGSTTCIMLLRGISLVHQSGWVVGIAVLAASGPAGAAAAAIAYSMGVSAFFAWVSTKCLNAVKPTVCECS